MKEKVRVRVGSVSSLINRVRILADKNGKGELHR